MTGHDDVRALMVVMVCVLGGCVRCMQPVGLGHVKPAHAVEKEEERPHLHSRCFFLGAITS